MGTLTYDSTAGPIRVDDVGLSQLKVVIAMKLRRQESFMMTWPHIGEGASGRQMVWIHPSIPLQLTFDIDPIPPVDTQRVEDLMHRLNATGELALDSLITSS